MHDKRTPKDVCGEAKFDVAGKMFSMVIATIQIHATRVAFNLLGNPDVDFEIRISDFAIEHEIRKRISPLRNPSSGWISIKKFKLGFLGFPFYHSIGKSEKGFAIIKCSFC